MFDKPVGNTVSWRKEKSEQVSSHKVMCLLCKNAPWTQWIPTVGGKERKADQIRIIIFLGSWKLSFCLWHLYYCSFNPIPKSHWNSEWSLKAARERENWGDEPECFRLQFGPLLPSPLPVFGLCKPCLCKLPLFLCLSGENSLCPCNWPWEVFFSLQASAGEWRAHGHTDREILEE